MIRAISKEVENDSDVFVESVNDQLLSRPIKDSETEQGISIKKGSLMLEEDNLYSYTKRDGKYNIGHWGLQENQQYYDFLVRNQ